MQSISSEVSGRELSLKSRVKIGASPIFFNQSQPEARARRLGVFIFIFRCASSLCVRKRVVQESGGAEDTRNMRFREAYICRTTRNGEPRYRVRLGGRTP